MNSERDTPMSNQRNNRPAVPGPPPGMPPVPPQVAEGLKSLLENLKPKHEPIIKSLRKLGVNFTVEGDSLTISIQELMRQEYLFMAGIDMSEFSNG